MNKESIITRPLEAREGQTRSWGVALLPKMVINEKWENEKSWMDVFLLCMVPPSPHQSDRWSKASLWERCYLTISHASIDPSIWHSIIHPIQWGKMGEEMIQEDLTDKPQVTICSRAVRICVKAYIWFSSFQILLPMAFPFNRTLLSCQEAEKCVKSILHCRVHFFQTHRLVAVP